MKKLFLILILVFAVNAGFPQINFEKGSLNDMLAKAKEQKKVLMVDVLTDWCKWCIELDNKVYAKKDVGDFANANQVNYKIDAEKGEGIDFAKKFKIQGYPTVLFLDGDGNEIDRIYGYVPYKDFFEMMQDYNKGKNTLSDLKKRLEADPNDLEANLKMADKEMTLGQLDQAKVHLQKVIDLDKDNTKGKTDDAKFKLASLADKDHIASELQSFIDSNPDSDVLKDAYITLAEFYFEKPDEAIKYYDIVLKKYPDDEMVKSSYGQFLNGQAVELADKGSGESDYKKGLDLISQALPYVTGSVNEASSYYIQSKLYYNLKDYNNALTSVDKALKIFDRKLYRDQKEKIQKELSMK